jgi:hypothetical protein
MITKRRKMNRQTAIDLYKKEREYEESIFGDYSQDPNMNVASVLLMIEVYLEKAKKAYVAKWEYDRPEWLLNANECKKGTCPVPSKTYEHLIKVFALSGAALEAFTDIDPMLWRDEGIKEKWRTKHRQ